MRNGKGREPRKAVVQAVQVVSGQVRQEGRGMKKGQCGRWAGRAVGEW